MDIAQAYVQIIPSTDGIQGNLTQALTGAGDAAGSAAGASAGNKFSAALGAAGKVGVAAVSAVAAGVAAAGTGFVKAAGDVASYGDNIDKMSQKIGISAQAYQEWDAVFQHSGTSVDVLQSGMKTLRTAMDGLGQSTGEATVDQQKLQQAQANYENKLLAVDKAQLAYNEAVQKSGEGSSQAQKAYINLQQALNNADVAYGKVQSAAAGTAPKLSDSAAALLQLGVSATDSSGNLRDEEEVFADVITALQGMENETERTRLASLLLGKSGTELGALLNTSAEDTQKMKDRVHELGGVMSDEAVKAAAAYQDSLQDMQTSIEGVKRNLISEFLPSITSVMDGVTELFSGDSDKGLALISTGIDGIITNISNRLPQFVETGGQIIFSIITAITENLPKIMESGVAVVMQLVQALVENIPRVNESGLQAILALVSGISQALPQLIPAAAEAVLTLTENLINNIPQIINAAIQLMTGLATGLMNALPLVIERLPEIIISIVNALVEAVPQIAAAGMQLLSALVTNLPEIIVKIVTGIGQIIVSIGSKIVEAVPEMAAKGYDLLCGIIQKVPEVITEIVSAVGDILKNIYEKIKSGVSNMVQAGKDLLAGLGQGIKDAVSGVVEKVKNLGQSILNAIKSFFGISSPSTVFKSIGSDLVQGLLNGLSETWKNITTFFGNAIKAIPDFFKSLPGNLLNVGKDIIGKLGSGAQEAWNSVQNKLSEFAGKIPGFFDKAKENLKNVGSNICISLGNGISTGYKNVSESLNIIRSRIRDWMSNLNNLKDSLITVGSNLMTGLRNGLVQAANNALDAAKTAASNVVNTVKKVFGVNSPSTIFAEIGENLDKGLAVGVIRGKGIVDQAMEGLTSDLAADAQVSLSSNFMTPAPGISRSANESDFQALMAMLAQYLPVLANMKVTLNDGTLVGHMTPGINRELGTMTYNQRREVLA